jgi:uncharacterized protein (DUF58 family)
MRPVSPSSGARWNRTWGRIPWSRRRSGPPSLLELDEQTWRRFDGRSIVTRSAARAGLGGEHRSRVGTASTEFADYRAYQPGDDVRRVDWNVYGRLGSLQVKVTETRQRLELVLVLDCSSSMDYGAPDKLTWAARAAAGLARVGLQQADVVRVVCLGEQPRAFGPVSGLQRFPELLRFMSAATPRGRIALDEQLTELRASLTSAGRGAGTLVVMLSDLMTASVTGLEAALDALLRAGADVAIVHVLSPQEESPDPRGDVVLVDAESGETLRVGMNAAAVRRYQERLAGWRADIESTCVRRGLRYVRAGTGRPVESVLLDDLRRVQLLR